MGRCFVRGAARVARLYYDPVTFDSAVYFEMAALFQGGRWSEALAYDYPPLYALLIAVLQPVLGLPMPPGCLLPLLPICSSCFRSSP